MKIAQNEERKFKDNYLWNIGASSFYEVLKVAHTILLMKVLPIATYGLIGSSFSLLYLTTRIVDLGATQTIIPFYHRIKKNKAAFHHIFFKQLLLPLTITSIIGSFFFYLINCKSKTLYHTKSLLIVISLLIITEALRSFLRQFLFLAYRAKTTILADQIPFYLYLIGVWGYYMLSPQPMTPLVIFLPLLIDSLLCLAIFSMLVVKFFQSLPDCMQQQKYQAFSRINLIKVRFWGYSMRMSKECFSTNILTPLFATTLGLEHAGIFYAAATFAAALQALIRSTIQYAGGPLLASISTQRIEQKKAIFYLLSHKIFHIALPLVIIIAVNYFPIIDLLTLHYGKVSTPASLLVTLFILYFMIIFTEFFFTLYEQFYLAEEAIQKILGLRLAEIITAFAISKHYKLMMYSPFVLLTIIMVKLISLFIIIGKSYVMWKVRPTYIPHPLYLVNALAAALLIRNIIIWLL